MNEMRDDGRPTDAIVSMLLAKQTYITGTANACRPRHVRSLSEKPTPVNASVARAWPTLERRWDEAAGLSLDVVA
jgi:hypothetical protein